MAAVLQVAAAAMNGRVQLQAIGGMRGASRQIAERIQRGPGGVMRLEH